MFHASCNCQVVGSESYCPGHTRYRRHRPRTHPVYGESWNTDRQPREHCHASPESEPLLPRLGGGGNDDVVDDRAVHVGVAVEETNQGGGGEVICSHPPEGTFLPGTTKRASHPINKNDGVVRHIPSLSQWLTRTRTGWDAANSVHAPT